MGVTGGLAVALAGVALAAPKKAPPAAVRASSERVDGEEAHAAALAFDGLLTTSWAEGVEGDGAGAWVEVQLDTPTDVTSVSIFPGTLRGSNRLLREYGRPKLVTVTLTGAAGDPVTRQERLLDPGDTGPFRTDVAIAGTGITTVRVTVDEAFPGGIYNDTCIAEIAVNFLGPRPAAFGEVDAWLASPLGKEAADGHRATARTMYDAIVTSEFGNKDFFDLFVEWAVDGAPYFRDKVTKTVPAGWRLMALQPDKTAIEALLKLKDSNAVPAIQRAALRTSGELSADLQRRADMFGAMQELGTYNQRNIAPWGQPGIAKGALRSFGAPLDLQVDGWGSFWVADTGNHRIQKFGVESGVVDRFVGSREPDVTDTWYYGKREWYASGSRPGTDSGEFVNPSDLAIVAGKEGDTVFVLDAKGRLTEIDPNLAVLRVVQLPTEGGAGEGEIHVMATGSEVVCIFGNEGWVYSRKDWEAPPSRFELKEGAPSSAVRYANGKLGLVYGGQLVLYATDGFRFGDQLGDTLGTGFENWAVTLDEDGKLWAVLDTGEVLKFKKPGKVDFRFRVSSWSLQNPRIGVFDDHVFVADGDKIVHVDALEAREAGGEPPKTGTGNLDLGE